jgi:lipopolysaccharide/colanic/teichoic acid biosynthesis glycosyltransferase
MEPMKMTTQLANLDGTLGPVPAHKSSLHAVETPRSAPAAAGAPIAMHPSQGRHAPAAFNDTSADELLSRTEFLRVVQREKRRTDRSHSALSVGVFETATTPHGVSRARDGLLVELAEVIRETDYLACIDERTVAVLLPDTGEAGLSSFLDKVALAGSSHAVDVAGATYPDTAFERLVADRLGTPRSRQTVEEAEEPLPNVPYGYSLKRTLDVVGALFALLVLSPLMLVVALAVRLTSPGPAIYRQQRMGQGGVPFTMFKFRSMRTDMDDKVHREFVAKLIDGKTHAAGAEAGTFKMKADPRITRIGRFIRKTSIDELPQFYNVLRGDMSLVGPRPPVLYEAERYKAWHRRRVLELKPGLTGIWQVEGRSRVTFDEMVRMDLRYLRQCSLQFDLGILLRTVVVVLRCDGAQ